MLEGSRREASTCVGATRGIRGAPAPRRNRRAKVIRGGVLALCGALVLVNGHISRADAPSLPTPQQVQQAQTRWNEGKAAFDAGELENALLAFRQAYAVVRHAVFLENIGEVELRMGRYVDACQHLSEFLRLMPNAPASQREIASRSLKKASEHIGRILIETNVTGAEVRIDDELVGSTSAPSIPWYVTPGSHSIVLRQRGYADAKATVRLERGTSQSVSLPMTPEPPQAVAARGQAPGPSTTGGATSEGPKRLDAGGGARTAGYVVGAAGALALTAGIVTRVLAFDQKNTVDTECPAKECNDVGWDALSKASTLQTASSLLLAAGAVGAGISAYLLLVPSASTGTPSLSASATPTDVNFTLHGRF